MKKNLAFAAIALVLLLGAAQAQSPNSVPGQLKEIQAQLSNLEAQNAALAAQVASNGPRKFYLTNAGHNGAGALSACATGYHMASLWEILDPSNLRYNTELVNSGVAFTREDSGSGPPAISIGWIRTGNTAGVPPNAGVGNCNAWTDTGGADWGTVVTLSNFWSPPPAGPSASVVGPWIAVTSTCNSVQKVWCVQN